MKKAPENAFTLIELIVVLVIVSLLAVIFLPRLSFLQKQSDLDTTAQKIVNTLRLARAKTLASENAQQFGVYFEQQNFYLFEGDTFSPGDPQNQTYTLDTRLRISEINLASGSALFEKIEGTTSGGSIKIEVTDQSEKYRLIFIDPSGSIELHQEITSDDDRLTDSRHVHVTYSQNTKNAGTLFLNFPQDSFFRFISFQDYLNAEKTQFEWSEAVEVNGEVQSLRIHSHELSDFQTIFCIHRDRRENSKALEISLDGQNLINYDAQGEVTQGTSLFAEEPEIQ